MVRESRRNQIRYWSLTLGGVDNSEFCRLSLTEL
jgi:hypothetical protein